MAMRFINRPMNERPPWHGTVPVYDNIRKGDTLARFPYNPRVNQIPRPLAEIYSPIERRYIRLVYIRGFGSDGLLECSLDTRSLDDRAKGPYTAISYTWSEETSVWYGKSSARNKAIRVDGIIVLVRSKIADILCLSHHFGRNPVWIDGLVINQDDLNEKRAQVTQMDAVYGTAQSILAILSGPTEATDFLFDRKNWTAGTLSNSHARMYRTMLQVQANDYWRRTWILQEIVLAKQRYLCVGNRLAHFDDVLGLFRHLENNGSIPQTLFGYASSLQVYLQAEPSYDPRSHVEANGGLFKDEDESLLSAKGRALFENVNFLDLLETSRRFNRGFDPRDLLYSRRGLARDGAELIPEVKYTPEWSVEDAYKDFARRCATSASRDCLKIITYTTWLPDNTLPSWVPDWRAPIAQWHRSVPAKFDAEEFHQIHWSNTQSVVSMDGNELKVQGRTLALITSDNERKFANLEMPSSLKSGYDFVVNNFSNSDRRQQLTDPPPPVAGDVVCLLRGCPAFAYLRPVGTNNTYKLVGQKEYYQNRAAVYLFADLMSHTSEKTQSGTYVQRVKFKGHAFEVINAIPEEAIRII